MKHKPVLGFIEGNGRMKTPIGWPIRLGIGFIAGLFIALMDNFSLSGEVSPIVIVALLLAAAFACGAIWGWRGGPAVVGVWVVVPSAHLVKHVLGLPDTLHPNTYKSVIMLAVFSFVVTAIGLGCGMLSRKLLPNGNDQGDK